MNRAVRLSGLAAIVVAACAGCEKRGEAERFGKTFYLDGAGNWGYGDSDVPEGLRQAGYRGDVEVYVWTLSFNPLLDQLNIPGARLRAAALTQRIRHYASQYPGRKINVIALSAGTGVAVWAIEGLDSSSHIQNLVLLGSSLSSTYDMRAALRNIDGKVYVYHSPHDTVLDAVRLVGTIDGLRGVDSAGQVGLRPPAGDRSKIVNIPWSDKWLRLGWAGYHTDCTNPTFVRYELARRILDDSETAVVEGSGRSALQPGGTRDKHGSQAGQPSRSPTSRPANDPEPRESGRARRSPT